MSQHCDCTSYCADDPRVARLEIPGCPQHVEARRQAVFSRVVLIETDADNERALQLVEQLIHKTLGPWHSVLFEAQVRLIEAYESRRWPIDPIDDGDEETRL